MTSIEKKIVSSRVSGLSVANLSKKQIKLDIDQILLRGAAISGCALPSTEFFAEIIGEELEIFIKDFGYSELTTEEILLAMRLNSRGDFKYPSGETMDKVIFFGNCFNVDYFSKILYNYMVLRNILDRKIQNIIDGY